jgi:hypothetical protein
MGSGLWGNNTQASTKKRPRKGAVDFAVSEPDQSIMNTALANQKRPGMG